MQLKWVQLKKEKEKKRKKKKEKKKKKDSIIEKRLFCLEVDTTTVCRAFTTLHTSIMAAGF